MYFITAFGVDSDSLDEFEKKYDPNKVTRARCFGYFSSFEEAKKAVDENRFDMNEAGYYTWIVIEDLHEGIHPIAVIRGWWRWDQTGKKAGEGSWEAGFKAPKFSEGKCNFCEVG